LNWKEKAAASRAAEASRFEANLLQIPDNFHPPELTKFIVDLLQIRVGLGRA
jgi:hypothetical protein